MAPTLRSVFFALPLLVASALTGCAANTDGDTASASDEVVADAPITLANFLTHPKIKAIRAQVTEIEGLALTKATNPGCDGYNEKFTDAGGKIRKLVTVGGEGGFEGSSTVYYSAAGAPIFMFNREADLTGAKPQLRETRVYFGATDILWQVVRTGEGATADTSLQTADRLPTQEERVNGVEGIGDPETTFKGTGCGEP